MGIGDLVSWNGNGYGLLHLIGPPTFIHDDHLDDPDSKLTGLVLDYYGENPDLPESEGHVKVLWNDGSHTITSAGLLRVISEGEKVF